MAVMHIGFNNQKPGIHRQRIPGKLKGKDTAMLFG